MIAFPKNHPDRQTGRRSGTERSRRRSSRSGITLYEVVLALLILLISLAALGHLISTGSRAAANTQLMSQASLLSESKLSEVIAGVEPMQPVSGASLSEAGEDWVWSLQVSPGPHPDLLELEVTVSHIGQDGRTDISSSLRRYVRDPQVFLDAAAFEAEIEQTREAEGTL